jgi:Domain of unknown function (DUF4271)
MTAKLIRTGITGILCLLMLWTINVQAAVNPAKYGVSLHIDSAARQRYVAARLDSMLDAHPQMALEQKVVAIAHTRTMHDKTADFYLMLCMVLLLGVIRYLDPRYFYSLWRSFYNPTLKHSQLKDKLEVATFQGLLMNIFFGISAGAYIYFVVRLFVPAAGRVDINPVVLLLLLMAGMLVIYLIKYLIMKFSGWAFRLEAITDDYIFNVFLINKVMSVLLIPFTFLMAFGDPELAGPAFLVSLILIAILLINRYTRSWQVFGSFFQFSKFHFFTYLCASELLPLAVLIKLLVSGLRV